MGALVGFPALTTDTYLASFPALASYFHVSASIIQMSLMAAMIGIATGQLIIGPLSDKYGRKAPLATSLILFMATTLGCLYSSSITPFIVFRFLQGLACSGGMVLSRAILADTFSGQKLAKSLSINTAILGFTPAIAPVIGGIILTFAQWQGEFVFLLIIGVIFLVSCLGFKESLPAERRTNHPGNHSSGSILSVLKNKTLLLYVMIFSFSMAVMFAYISSSPFIFQEHYKLTPLLYGIFFGINAFSLATGSLLSSCFKDQEKAVRLGALGLIVMAIITVIVLFSGVSYLYFEASIIIMFISNGLIYPSSTTLAMASNRQKAGSASAILGTLSFLFGGIVSPLAGLGNILQSTAIALIVCSSIVVVLALLPRYTKKAKPSAENSGQP